MRILTITWYYGQAYSLGLIQAAHLMGKDRPILDIVKNREIFEELCRSGFALVKENATKAIENLILPAIDAHVIAGSNPKQIAVLENLRRQEFGLGSSRPFRAGHGRRAVETRRMAGMED